MGYKKGDVVYCFAKWLDQQDENYDIVYDKDNENMPWSWGEFGKDGHKHVMRGIVAKKIRYTKAMAANNADVTYEVKWDHDSDILTMNEEHLFRREVSGEDFLGLGNKRRASRNRTSSSQGNRANDTEFDYNIPDGHQVQSREDSEEEEEECVSASDSEEEDGESEEEDGESEEEDSESEEEDSDPWHNWTKDGDWSDPKEANGPHIFLGKARLSGGFNHYREAGPLEYLFHFLPVSYIRLIILEATNKRARYLDANWTDITFSEFIVWMGLWLCLTIARPNERRECWRNQEDEEDMPLPYQFDFGKHMARKRFEDILSSLRLTDTPDDDIVTGDPANAFRDFIDAAN